MSVWSWFRARRWWTKIIIGAPPALLAVAALYVLGRTGQFVAAEKEAGLFIPSTANVVIRAKDLEGHLQRIEETVAWRGLHHRVLKDPAIRPAINKTLKDAGLPTLDELEDKRNRDLYSTDVLLRAIGRDAVAALRVEDGRGSLRAVAITRLRWSDYLLTPFAPLFLKSEEVAGRSALRLRMGKTDLFIALEGRLALVATDRELLTQALRRTGTESSTDRPILARVEIGNAPALVEARRMVGESGAFPQVRMESVRAVEASIDLSGPAAVVDAVLEGAEPAREDAAPPHAFARLAPPNTTGIYVSASGAHELFEGLRSMKATGPKDSIVLNLHEALAGSAPSSTASTTAAGPERSIDASTARTDSMRTCGNAPDSPTMRRASTSAGAFPISTRAKIGRSVDDSVPVRRSACVRSSRSVATSASRPSRAMKRSVFPIRSRSADRPATSSDFKKSGAKGVRR